MKTLKTTLVAVVLFAISFPAPAQQVDQTEGENNSQIEKLINLYATAMMGWEVEQRCRHLGETLDAQFADNYKVVDDFMNDLLVDEAINNIKTGVDNAFTSDSDFTCGNDSIDFATESFRITRDLATNIRSLIAPSSQ